jgi:hypothetical protein
MIGPLHLGSDAMNWKLGQLLYISDWSKFVGPKLGFILDQTHCIWAYWVTSFILAIGLAGMTINRDFEFCTCNLSRNGQLDKTYSRTSLVTSIEIKERSVKEVRLKLCRNSLVKV